MVDTFTDVHVKSWIYKLQHDLLRIFRLMLIFLNSEMYMYGHLYAKSTRKGIKLKYELSIYALGISVALIFLCRNSD